ncbi:retrotransposon protein, putative, ty1-copia subclass [Tanacetum coccineum]
METEGKGRASELVTGSSQATIIDSAEVGSSKRAAKAKLNHEDIRAIRILLAIAMFYDYEIWQMDVKTTFLKDHISEDVYMVQPAGFVDPKYPNKVCKLQRSIYGLKQASRS